MAVPIRFGVDPTGYVTVTGGVATGGSLTLTLNSTSVAFDMGGFTGNWTVLGVGSRSGNQTLGLVVGESYSLSMAGAVNPIHFFVDTTNSVVVRGAGANGGVGSLAVPTAAVSFNANGFKGSWTLTGMFTGIGNISFVLPLNQSYTLDLGTGK